MNSLGLAKLHFKSLDGVPCNDEGIPEFQNLFSDFYSDDDLVEFALKYCPDFNATVFKFTTGITI